MFTIRKATVSDNAEVYGRTLDLLKFHYGSSENSQLTEQGLLELQKENVLQILALFLNQETEGNEIGKDEKIIGYTIFLPEFDILFSSYGILLDHFFIQEEFRGKGQGRELLKAVSLAAKAQSAKYIKVYFQKGHNLDQFYQHFGFNNMTDADPHLHVFEVYGLEEILRCFQLDLGRIPAEGLSSSLFKMKIQLGNGIEAWPMIHGSSDFQNKIKIMLTACLPNRVNNEKSNHFPEGKLIIFAQFASGNGIGGVIQTLKGSLRKANLSLQSTAIEIWQGIDRLNQLTLEDRIDASFCAFLEKPSFCGWLGKMLTLCDFVGDLSLLTKDIITERIKYWAEQWKILKGVDFEVPVCDSTNSKYQHLLTLLGQNGIPDGSEKDGWNFAVLDEAHMEEIISK